MLQLHVGGGGEREVWHRLGSWVAAGVLVPATPACCPSAAKGCEGLTPATASAARRGKARHPPPSTPGTQMTTTPPKTPN